MSHVHVLFDHGAWADGAIPQSPIPVCGLGGSNNYQGGVRKTRQTEY
jgi:hypothetical protein